MCLCLNRVRSVKLASSRMCEKGRGIYKVSRFSIAYGFRVTKMGRWGPTHSIKSKINTNLDQYEREIIDEKRDKCNGR
ncbi:hypothetical protein MCO_01505 [Bartonella sp. DB5-6]|nr:hypothetical protein MCO_01505 [Bartonella sp. DB5-6]